MEIDERYAHITCQCGEQIQIVNEKGDDWDEEQTALAYQTHLETH